jgi:membrane-bound serine protease (ClpP class)
MKHLKILLVIICLIFYQIAISAEKNKEKEVKLNSIDIIALEGVINPISARFLIKNIKKAQKTQSLIIIEMDTPGGLGQAMHDIVKVILNCSVPVVTYVTPKGARAASAGVFIALASDVIAMAPSTRIGAAHPVGIGHEISKTMIEKATADMVALAKSIAKRKHRNVEWAVLAIKKNSSLTEEEAKKRKVIDFIAKDREELLEKLHGFVIHKDSKKLTLSTKDKNINYIKMNFREKFLHAITDPNIAYIFLMLGIYGLIYEFASPGIGLGAVLGGIFLILAFLGLQALPINLVGLLLIILGFILLILDLKIQSHGILTIGGLISLLIGSFILIDTTEAIYLKISTKLIIGVIIATALFFIVALSLGIKAQLPRPVTGRIAMIGKTGKALTNIDSKGGMVFVEGEYWQAFSEIPIQEGEKVEVKRVKGMELQVDKPQEELKK